MYFMAIKSCYSPVEMKTMSIKNKRASICKLVPNSYIIEGRPLPPLPDGDFFTLICYNYARNRYFKT